MAKQKGLGRGIDALFSTDIDTVLNEEDKHRIQQVPLSRIVPDPKQPRRIFDEHDLEGLAASIERHGILQPLIVVEAAGKLQIVAGERRYRAAKILKLQEVPVLVRSLEEIERLEIALIENVQRVDLSPYEQALSIYRLKDQFNVEYNETARRLGKSPTTISNIVRLLQLPKSAIIALQDGKISEGHARAILALDNNPEKQEELLRYILENSWTVRQAEKYAQENKAVASKSRKNLVDLDLSRKLGASVTVRPKKRGGEIVIAYKNDSELERLKKQFGV